MEIVNGLIDQLSRDSDQVLSPPSQLLRLARPSQPGETQFGDGRPGTPLSDAALLTNSKDEPNLGAELRAEIDTADEVDLLCAFVKWHGLRLLEPELARLQERGAPLRVITTTYMGATERGALDRLVRDFGAEVKIQYDAQRTRLHAKAWLFRRDTGFDTAYVGSSNLSRAALLDGVEWNVRLSRVATPDAARRSSAPPSTPTGTTELRALRPGPRTATGSTTRWPRRRASATHDRVTISLSGLEVRPYPYQQEMLDALEVERIVHDRHRNLVVAATGTGKTVVAALDYRRLVQPSDRRSALAALRRAPPGDPRAVAADLPGGARATPTSASSTSAARARSAGSMSSPACSR